MRRRAQEKQLLEHELIDQADETWVVSPSNSNYFGRSGHANLSNWFQTLSMCPARRAPFALRRDYLFIGGFQHRPNDAVLFFGWAVLNGKSTASVAGACRSPTKGAAPGLAARRCATSSGRLTGASAGRHCCARCLPISSTIRTPSCAGRRPRRRAISDRLRRGSSITPAAAIRSVTNWRPWPPVTSTRSLPGSSPLALRGWRSSAAARRSSSRGSAEAAKSRLVEPLGDALHGAVHLARAAAQSLGAGSLMGGCAGRKARR